MSRWWQQRPHETKRGEAGRLILGNVDALAAYISQRDMMIMQGFVNEFHEELSGLARVEVTGRGFEITQPFILKQGTGPGHTNLTEAAAQFVLELAQRGESPAPYKCWWHSHVNFDPFWSGRDETTSQGFGNQFMLSVVLNKKREFSVRFDQYRPFPLTIYDIPLNIEVQDDPEITAFCKKEIKDKIFTGPLRDFWRRGRRIIVADPSDQDSAPLSLKGIMGHQIPILTGEDEGRDDADGDASQVGDTGDGPPTGGGKS